jgi:hypothetical protein
MDKAEKKELLEIPSNSQETKLSEVLEDIKQSNGKKINMTNKRIDFDKKALKRLETMLPIYKEEIGEANTSELYSYVVRKAIDSLFEGDFKQKLEEL